MVIQDCPTSHRDLVANALDLHIYTTALCLVCLDAMASAGLVAYATTVHYRDRNVRIIEGPGKLRDRFNELSCSTGCPASTDIESRASEDIHGRSVCSCLAQHPSCPLFGSLSMVLPPVRPPRRGNGDR